MLCTRGNILREYHLTALFQRIYGCQIISDDIKSPSDFCYKISVKRRLNGNFMDCGGTESRSLLFEGSGKKKKIL